MTSFMTKNGYCRASIAVHKRVYAELLVTHAHLDAECPYLYLYDTKMCKP